MDTKQLTAFRNDHKNVIALVVICIFSTIGNFMALAFALNWIRGWRGVGIGLWFGVRILRKGRRRLIHFRVMITLLDAIKF